MPTLTMDAFVGRRVAITRALVCAMQGQFPVLAGGDGGLAVVFRTGAAHYGLTGTLATAGSADGGLTWSAPVEVAARGRDVRNPALGVDGARWLLAYWQAGMHCYPGGKWQLPAADGELAPDLFVIASDDQGQSWSAPAPYRSELLAWCSPFGRIVRLPDGCLAMAAYGPARGGAATRFDAIVIRSRDGGATWGDESRVLAEASELSLCPDGDRLHGAVRRADGSTAVVTSADGGRTWSAPVAATRSGEHPADLCVLAGGRLLLTFGRRRRPLGVGALVSDDGGATWDGGREVILAGDGIGNDVGYPSTVALAGGALVTVCYFARGSGPSEPVDGWGDTSCQALHYRADLFG